MIRSSGVSWPTTPTMPTMLLAQATPQSTHNRRAKIPPTVSRIRFIVRAITGSPQARITLPRSTRATPAQTLTQFRL